MYIPHESLRPICHEQFEYAYEAAIAQGDNRQRVRNLLFEVMHLMFVRAVGTKVKEYTAVYIKNILELLSYDEIIRTAGLTEKVRVYLASLIDKVYEPSFLQEKQEIQNEALPFFAQQRDNSDFAAEQFKTCLQEDTFRIDNFEKLKKYFDNQEADADSNDNVSAIEYIPAQQSNPPEKTFVEEQGAYTENNLSLTAPPEEKFDTKSHDIPIRTQSNNLIMGTISFEPQSLDDFIGQTKTVKELKDAIKVAKMDGKKCIADKGGILFLGNKGLGKSTLMELTAKELGVKYEYFDATSMKNDVASRRSFDLFLERIAKEDVPVVIGVDEIHELPNDIQSRLLTLLQSRMYSNLNTAGQVVNIPIKEFTFIGATTEAYAILETVYDRFNKGLVCTLVDYTFDELVQIITFKCAHYGLTVTECAIDEIISRGRSSLREIESYIIKLRRKAKLEARNQIDTEMTNVLFDELGIDKAGLYEKDLEILLALKDAPNYTLSEENLSNRVNISLSDFQKMRKPFLVRAGYIITINRGQCLTEKALTYLKAYKKVQESELRHSASHEVTDNSFIDGEIINNEVAVKDALYKVTPKEQDKGELILSLLTSKYAGQVLSKEQIAAELNLPDTEVITLLTILCDKGLINLCIEGVEASSQAYEN